MGVYGVHGEPPHGIMCPGCIARYQGRKPEMLPPPMGE
ncbi:hypothetical protein AWT69_004002 [Pseudomonas putida]|nr:hypothetical protein AWT69_004002 [Pseudomonas putida]